MKEELRGSPESWDSAHNKELLNVFEARGQSCDAGNVNPVPRAGGVRVAGGGEFQ